MDFIELDGIAMMGSKKAPLSRNLKNKYPKVIALLYSFDCHSPIH